MSGLTAGGTLTPVFDISLSVVPEFDISPVCSAVPVFAFLIVEQPVEYRPVSRGMWSLAGRTIRMGRKVNTGTQTTEVAARVSGPGGLAGGALLIGVRRHTIFRSIAATAVSCPSKRFASCPNASAMRCNLINPKDLTRPVTTGLAQSTFNGDKNQ